MLSESWIQFQWYLALEKIWLWKKWWVWHKSCYVKFSKEKVERATKKWGTQRAATVERNSLAQLSACQWTEWLVSGRWAPSWIGADESIRQNCKKHSEWLSDLIALEAKYHQQCIAALRNRYRYLMRKYEHEAGCYSEEIKAKARVLVELLTVI